MSNVKISLSPDPIQKGKPFSISLSGDLDEVTTAGNIIVDLHVKALGVINEPVNASIPFTVTPGMQSGAQSLTVGPVTLPSLPVGAVVIGTLRFTNGKDEPIACGKLNLNVPLLEGKADREVEASSP